MGKGRSPLLLTVIATLLLGTSTGCFPVRHVDVMKGLEHVRSEAPLAAPESLGPQRVKVTLVSSQMMGCFLQKVESEAEREQAGKIRCEGFAVPKEDPNAEIARRAKEAEKTLGAGVCFEGFASALERALHERLSQHFSDVTIEVQGPEVATRADFQVDAELTHYLDTWRTGDKRVVVSLHATGSEQPFEGNVVDRIGNGQLAWMIPVGVLTFPLGVAIGSAILSSKETRMVERNAAGAIDQAAEALAAHVVQRAVALEVRTDLRVAIHLR